MNSLEPDESHTVFVDDNDGYKQTEEDDLIYAKNLQEDEFRVDLLYLYYLREKYIGTNITSPKKQKKKELSKEKDAICESKPESKSNDDNSIEVDLNNITKNMDEMFVACGLKEMHKGRKKYSCMNTTGLLYSADTGELYCNNVSVWAYYIESIIHCIYSGIMTMVLKDGEDGEKALEIICKTNKSLGSIDQIECIYYFQKIKINPKKKYCTHDSKKNKFPTSDLQVKTLYSHNLL